MTFISPLLKEVESRQNEEEIESDHPCLTNDDCIGNGDFTICGCVLDDCGICIYPDEEPDARSDAKGTF